MRRLNSLEACRTRGRGNDRTPRSYGIERGRGPVSPSFRRMIFASETGFGRGAPPSRPRGRTRLLPNRNVAAPADGRVRYAHGMEPTDATAPQIQDSQDGRRAVQRRGTVRVVTVAYNPGEELVRFLESLGRASRRRVRVVIADNGSEHEIVREAAERFGAEVVTDGTKVADRKSVV